MPKVTNTSKKIIGFRGTTLTTEADPSYIWIPFVPKNRFGILSEHIWVTRGRGELFTLRPGDTKMLPPEFDEDHPTVAMFIERGWLLVEPNPATVTT